jgi:hypothetical protein
MVILLLRSADRDRESLIEPRSCNFLHGESRIRLPPKLPSIEYPICACPAYSLANNKL